MKWTYFSATIPGNWHHAVSWLNEFHPDWDVIAMDYVACDATIIVYRIPEPRF